MNIKFVFEDSSCIIIIQEYIIIKLVLYIQACLTWTIFCLTHEDQICI